MNEYFVHRVISWLKEITTSEGEFRLSLKNRPTLMSNCFGLSLLNLIKASDKIDFVQVPFLCKSVFNAYYKNKDIFLDTLLKEEEIYSHLHPYDYLVEQTSYFCRHVLYILGYEVPLNPEAQPQINDPVWVKSYLSDLDWKDPWLESNKAMFLLDRLTFISIRGSKEKIPSPSLNAAFDYFDSSIDSKTGLWGTDRNSGLMRGVAGGYHIIPYYLFFKRPLPFAEQTVRSVLSLENSDGLFFPIAGGCACIDTDAVGTLALLYPLVPSYQEEIQSVLARNRKFIISLQTLEGGFVESGASSSQRLSEAKSNSSDQLDQIWTSGTTMKYSSWSIMEYDTDKPDLWSTYFRLLSIAYCDAVLNEEQVKQWNFESIPGLALSPIFCAG